jgi:hypothetical protein
LGHEDSNSVTMDEMVLMCAGKPVRSRQDQSVKENK